MKKITLFLIITLVALLLFNACKKASTPNDENEHEAINKLEIVFSEGGTVVGNFIVEDPDGDGGNPPARIDTIKLTAGKTYTAVISFKNIVGTVVKDLSAKIQTQANAHEIYYITNGLAINITKNDKDPLGRPLGLNSTWQTSAAGSGSILVKLMHKPFTKGFNDSPDVGHSDISIAMPVKVI